MLRFEMDILESRRTCTWEYQPRVFGRMCARCARLVRDYAESTRSKGYKDAASDLGFIINESVRG